MAFCKRRWAATSWATPLVAAELALGIELRQRAQLHPAPLLLSILPSEIPFLTLPAEGTATHRSDNSAGAGLRRR